MNLAAALLALTLMQTAFARQGFGRGQQRRAYAAAARGGSRRK